MEKYFEKDGIRVQVLTLHQENRLKKLGYKEVRVQISKEKAAPEKATKKVAAKAGD